MNKIEIGNRIRSLREEKKLSQKKFGDSIGMTQAGVASIEKGGGISLETIEKISNAYAKEVAWILLGQASTKPGIPIYDVDFSAGPLTQYQDHPPEIIGRIDMNGYKNCIGFVKVKGSSMEPVLNSGDFIGLEPMAPKEIEWGQIYAVVMRDGRRVVKYVRKAEDEERLILRSENTKAFDDIDVHKREIVEIFRTRGPVKFS